jgi:hypothetical protein
MKALSLIFLTLFLGKSCTNEAQKDIAKATFEYTASTRGFFQKTTIQNKKAIISTDRNGEKNPEELLISDSDWNEIISYFKNLNLEKLPTLKDPTQKRFYDGAAIANLKIRYKNKDYQTSDFDHGYPPIEIEKVVNKIVAMGQKTE